MRVHGCVSVAREVLGARDDPALCSPRTKAATCRATSSASAPNARIPITGFSGFVLTSATGARFRFTPASTRSAPIAAATSSVSDVVDFAERGVPRIRASRRRLEPRHVAALFVDRDQDVLALGPQLSRQHRELLSALDVPGVEDDAAEPLVEPAPDPVGRVGALEPGEDASRRKPLEVELIPSRRAVSPKAILRCTRRKKMTTGIAVSVDAAMSPPQSVFRLEPVK